MRRELVAGSAIALTKSDTTVIAETFGLYVGGAGDVNVTMKDGRNALFVGVPAGTVLPIQVTKLLSTSTSATSVLALYDE